MCLPKCPQTGKSTFRSRGEALEWVRRPGQPFGRFRRPHRAYLCPFCRCWHLTKQPFNRDPIYRKRRLQRLARLAQHLDHYGDADD